MDEQQRRCYVAVESNRLGPGSQRLLSQITGLDDKTIRRGQQELEASLAQRRSRAGACGRCRAKACRKKDVELEPALQQLGEPETAGDPMSEQKWVPSHLRHLSQRLKDLGHSISPPTVGRLLRKLGYALRVNGKKHEASAAHRQRHEQFEQIQAHKQRFQAAGWPIISVDTKQKELIGNFRNAGQLWCQQADEVNVHDFPSEAVARAVPYGLYDVSRNRGSVYVGLWADTPAFAVATIARCWQEEGRQNYPLANHLLLLAESGGRNGCRPRCFKQQLQEQLRDRSGLSVTVCHYPTGCSKWKPIEHRLFSQISLNWAGKPLRSLETRLTYLRGTTTTTGLRVRAALLEGSYEKGQKVSAAQLKHSLSNIIVSVASGPTRSDPM